MGQVLRRGPRDELPGRPRGGHALPALPGLRGQVRPAGRLRVRLQQPRPRRLLPIGRGDAVGGLPADLRRVPRARRAGARRRGVISERPGPRSGRQVGLDRGARDFERRAPRRRRVPGARQPARLQEAQVVARGSAGRSGVAGRAGAEHGRGGAFRGVQVRARTGQCTNQITPSTPSTRLTGRFMHRYRRRSGAMSSTPGPTGSATCRGASSPRTRRPG
mmetsp:Transcript_4205/g.10553  ORF Transcript_4205/g.10553 Transcript_4205/m.10553 type:complete len:219 (-) Transcript_4205:258-914(-)